MRFDKTQSEDYLAPLVTIFKKRAIKTYSFLIPDLICLQFLQQKPRLVSDILQHKCLETSKFRNQAQSEINFQDFTHPSTLRYCNFDLSPQEFSLMIWILIGFVTWGDFCCSTDCFHDFRDFPPWQLFEYLVTLSRISIRRTDSRPLRIQKWWSWREKIWRLSLIPNWKLTRSPTPTNTKCRLQLRCLTR